MYSSQHPVIAMTPSIPPNKKVKGSAGPYLLLIAVSASSQLNKRGGATGLQVCACAEGH